MERPASWPVLLTAIGSFLITTATLVQYIQAHRAGQSGGYLPIVFGAFAFGLLVAGCDYFPKPKAARSAHTSSLLGMLASGAFFAVVLGALIWTFGS